MRDIPIFKMDPERLRKLNARIADEKENTAPRGEVLTRLMFKVGGVLWLVVEIISCGPGERAVVATSLYRKINSEEYERIRFLIPDQLPVDRECYSIDYEDKWYHARVVSG